jgi:hypothetical protein
MVFQAVYDLILIFLSKLIKGLRKLLLQYFLLRKLKKETTNVLAFAKLENQYLASA